MITLFGLAGSGKGTQGRALAEIFGWRWLSVGEAIRQTNEYDDIIQPGQHDPRRRCHQDDGETNCQGRR